MSLLNNVSIRAKVMVAFGLLILMFVGFGGFAISRMALLDASITQMNSHWLPSVRESSLLKYQVARHRTVLARQILNFDPADLKRDDEEIRALDAQIKVTLDKYGTLISSPEVRVKFENFRKDWSEYTSSMAAVQEAARRNDDEAATKAFLAGLPKNGMLTAETEALTQSSIDGSAVEEKHAEAVYDFAKVATFALIGVVLALGIGASLIVIVGVSTPIAAMTKVMEVLSGGNLNTEIPSRDRRDEIGAMAKSVQVFKESMQEAARLHAEQEEIKRKA